MRRNTLAFLVVSLLLPSTGSALPANHDDVQTHFRDLVPYLRAQDVSEWPQARQIARHQTLNVLEAYGEEGRFPENRWNPNSITPTFIDDQGTRCAVAHLMIETGYDEAAYAIANQQNDAWVGEFNHPTVGEWLDFSGLTIDEASWIQPSYSFCIEEVEFLEPQTEANCGDTVELRVDPDSQPVFEGDDSRFELGCYATASWDHYSGPAVEFLTVANSPVAQFELPPSH